MSLLARVRAWFRPPAEPRPELSPSLPVTSPLAEQSERSTLASEVRSEWVPVAPPAPQPSWLDNEELLRDEGVLFGLSDTDPSEKLAAIRSYFAEQAAGLEHERERMDEKIGELNLWINQNDDQTTDLENRIESLKAAAFTESHHLPRVLAGLLLSLGMSIGNYFLIADTLREAYPESGLVALGVFLTGMFTLFNRTSVLHTSEPERLAPRWKRVLEEVGVPLAAAAFVFVHAWTSQPPLRAWALGLFVFFLFLFAGKLLLGQLTLLKLEWDVYARQRQLRRDKVLKVQEWETEIESLKTATVAHRHEKQEILPRYADVTGRLLQLSARRDRLVQLFESEFLLAKNYRNRLTRRQLQRLTGQSFQEE
jgi:hypothetical protein